MKPKPKPKPKAAPLGNMSYGEKRALIAQLEAELAASKRDELRKLRDEVVALTKERGFTARELVDALRSGIKTQKPKGTRYRDPDHPENVWTGKGHRPHWLKALVAKGHEVEEFII